MYFKIIVILILSAFSFLMSIELTEAEKQFLVQKKTISFVMTNYPPFEFVNANNEFDGMTVELIRWISTETGFKADFTLQSFADAKASVLSAKKDVITTFFYSDERDKVYDFTDKLYEIPASIFIQADRTDIKDLRDLQNKTIAVQKEDFAVEFLQKEKIVCNFKYTDNFGEATQLVVNGEADAIIGDEQVVLYYLFSNNFYDKVKKVGKQLYGGKSCMGSQQDNRLLISILNKGIKDARNKGIIDKINQKWLGIKFEKSDSFLTNYGKYLLLFFIIALIIILTLWFWNAHLKKLVAKRTTELEIEMHKRLESEKLYRLITENTIDVIWSMDLNYNFIYLSPSVNPFLKIPAGQQLVMRADKYLTKSSEVKFLQEASGLIERARKPHKDSLSIVIELEYVGADNSLILGESHITIMSDDQSNPIGLVGVTRDITNRRNTEEFLIRSERHKKLVLNTIPDMIFTLTSQGLYTDFKPGVNSPLMKPEQIIGSYIQDMPIASELKDYMLNGVKKALATSELVILEYSLGSGGEQQYFEARIGKIGDDEAIGIVRDISDRKKAELSLAYEKEQLSTTLRSIGDGVIVTDANRNILLFNKAAENILGISDYKAYGQLVSDLFTVRHAVNAKQINPMEMVLQTGVIYLPENDFILTTRDGSQKYVALSAAPICDLSGKVDGGVLTFRDVGEKLRLQDEINKTQKLESIGLLAGGIAHDFNNYLTGIIGNISLVMLKLPDSDNLYNLLSEAEKAAIRAKDLTQQLLTFAKGGAPVKEQISIEELIRDSAGFVLRGSKSACNYVFSEDLWLADIDRGQVSQVIQNVVLNASQAMTEGGLITISVENTVVKMSDHKMVNSGDYLKVTIADNGPGIDENDLKKIFLPYYSTKTAGHGLGLSISHSILRRHGGDIEVTSELGKGAVFMIYLPASRSKAGPKAVKESDFFGNLEKVLFMDDEEMLREFVGSLFDSFGYKCRCVADGSAAIEAYREALDQGSAYDLVIMDLTVPGGLGGEIAIKDILAINPQAKVIVSSGYSNHPIMSNYQSYGFKGVIVKPFELDKFFSVVKSVLKT